MYNTYVKQGNYDGEVVAVKFLHDDVAQLFDDRLFQIEVVKLLMVHHPNIVRLYGYCHETCYKYVEQKGKNHWVRHTYRVLCFEYLQGGSLDVRLRGTM